MIIVATVCRKIYIWWLFYKAKTLATQWRINVVKDNNNTELREIQTIFIILNLALEKRSNV